MRRIVSFLEMVQLHRREVLDRRLSQCVLEAATDLVEMVSSQISQKNVLWRLRCKDVRDMAAVRDGLRNTNMFSGRPAKSNQRCIDLKCIVILHDGRAETLLVYSMQRARVYKPRID